MAAAEKLAQKEAEKLKKEQEKQAKKQEEALKKQAESLKKAQEAQVKADQAARKAREQQEKKQIAFLKQQMAERKAKFSNNFSHVWSNGEPGVSAFELNIDLSAGGQEEVIAKLFKNKIVLTSKSFQVAFKDSFTTMKVIWTPESNLSSLLVPSTTTALKNSELSPATSPQAKNILRVIMVFQLSTLLPILLALVAKSTLSGPLNRPPKTRTLLLSASAKRLKRRNQRVMLKSNSRLATKTKKMKKKRMMMTKKKPPKSDQYIYIFKVFKKTFL